MSRQHVSSKLPPDKTTELINRLKKLPEDATLIRDRKGQAVYKLSFDNQDMVAKYYRMRKPSNRWVAACGFSRARRSYRNGFKLIEAGIRTPRPQLVLEPGSPLPNCTYLVTEWLPGELLQDFLPDHPECYTSFVEQIATIVTKLHEHKLSHGDFHARNFLVDDQGSLILIDLDQTRSHLFQHRLRRRYDRDRRFLLSSLKDFPDFAQQLDTALPTAS